MGWTLVPGASRESVIEEARASFNGDGSFRDRNEHDQLVTHNVRMSCVRGSVLWTLVDVTVDGVPRGPFIGCVLIEREGGYWGYKVMDETEGPCYYSVPRAYLDASTCELGYAPAWRQKCRERASARR